MGNHNNEHHRGRPQVYLTVKKFDEFLNNHFFHLKVEVRVALVISITILGILLARLV